MGLDDWLKDDASLDAALNQLGAPSGSTPTVEASEILAHATALLEAATVGGVAAQQVGGAAATQVVGAGLGQVSSVTAGLAGWKTATVAIGMLSSGFVGGIVVQNQVQVLEVSSAKIEQAEHVPAPMRLEAQPQVSPPADHQNSSSPSPLVADASSGGTPQTTSSVQPKEPRRGVPSEGSSELGGASSLGQAPSEPSPSVRSTARSTPTEPTRNTDAVGFGAGSYTGEVSGLTRLEHSKASTLTERADEAMEGLPARALDGESGVSERDGLAENRPGSQHLDNKGAAIHPMGSLEDDHAHTSEGGQAPVVPDPSHQQAGVIPEPSATEPIIEQLSMRPKKPAKSPPKKAVDTANIERERGERERRSQLNGHLFTGAMSHFRAQQAQAVRLGVGTYVETNRPTFIRAGLDLSFDVYPTTDNWVTNVGAELGLGTDHLPGRASLNWMLTVQDEKADPMCHRAVAPELTMCSAWYTGPRIRAELSDRFWVASDLKIPIGAFASSSYTSVGLIVGVNGWRKRP